MDYFYQENLETFSFFFTNQLTLQQKINTNKYNCKQNTVVLNSLFIISAYMNTSNLYLLLNFSYFYTEISRYQMIHTDSSRFQNSYAYKDTFRGNLKSSLPEIYKNTLHKMCNFMTSYSAPKFNSIVFSFTYQFYLFLRMFQMGHYSRHLSAW